MDVYEASEQLGYIRCRELVFTGHVASRRSARFCKVLVLQEAQTKTQCPMPTFPRSKASMQSYWVSKVNINRTAERIGDLMNIYRGSEYSISQVCSGSGLIMPSCVLCAFSCYGRTGGSIFTLEVWCRLPVSFLTNLWQNFSDPNGHQQNPGQLLEVLENFLL